MEKKANKKFKRVFDIPVKGISDYYRSYIDSKKDNTILKEVDFKYILHSFHRYFTERVSKGDKFKRYKN